MLGAIVTFVVSCAPPNTPGADWRTTGGAPGNTRYSPLDQINRGNVAQLTVAWTYHTGDLPLEHSEIQATPIVVDGVLYTTTPKLAVVALRADKGTLLWRFDPFPNRHTQPHVNRGVVYWAAGQRIFFAIERRLYALDARTGKPIRRFGDSGWIDLSVGLGRDIGDAYLVSTSPGVVYQDVLIWGTRVGEEDGSAPGHIRAYNARTGKVRWTFHTIPWPAESGYDTWPAESFQKAGGANSWAGMTVDTTRGVVYIPTGSATPDFYGGDRHGANLFANSLLALDALTGRRLWHFQTVHHDLWDRDLPAAPNLVTVTSGTKRVDAVAQITKSGFVFLFDRQSGQPLFPVTERPVPKSDLWGEQTSPTQPFPLKPGPFARQSINEADVTPTERRRFRRLRHGSLFTPPSREGTLVLPGFDGGGEWGGAAVDPTSGVLYVNASDVPWIAAMREVRNGLDAYAARCARCHGADRLGRDRAPSLIDLSSRMSLEQLEALLERGRGFMPSFATLPEKEKCAVIASVLRTACRAQPRGAEPPITRQTPPYEFAGYEKWRDSRGLPAIKPPWKHLERDRPEHGRLRLAHSARRAVRHRAVRWSDRHRGRPGVHCCNDGWQVPGIRQVDGPAPLGDDVAGCGIRDAEYIRCRWKAVRGDCRRRRKTRNTIGRYLCGVHTALAHRSSWPPWASWRPRRGS